MKKRQSLERRCAMDLVTTIHVMNLSGEADTHNHTVNLLPTDGAGDVSGQMKGKKLEADYCSSCQSTSSRSTIRSSPPPCEDHITGQCVRNDHDDASCIVYYHNNNKPRCRDDYYFRNIFGYKNKSLKSMATMATYGNKVDFNKVEPLEMKLDSKYSSSSATLNKHLYPSPFELRHVQGSPLSSLTPTLTCSSKVANHTSAIVSNRYNHAQSETVTIDKKKKGVCGDSTLAIARPDDAHNAAVLVASIKKLAIEKKTIHNHLPQDTVDGTRKPISKITMIRRRGMVWEGSKSSNDGQGKNLEHSSLLPSQASEAKRLKSRIPTMHIHPPKPDNYGYKATPPHRITVTNPIKKTTPKTVLRKSSSWKKYPELETFLIENFDTFLNFSAHNLAVQQEQYIYRLTGRMIEFAMTRGYIFDPDSFSFVAIRNRIRRYFRDHIQHIHKKRAVILVHTTSTNREA